MVYEIRIGGRCVYKTESKEDAHRQFDACVFLSKHPYGFATGQFVTLT